MLPEELFQSCDLLRVELSVVGRLVFVRLHVALTHVGTGTLENVALGLEVVAHLVDVLDWGLVLHVDCWLFLWVFGFECTERVVGLESSLHGTSRTEHHTKSNL